MTYTPIYKHKTKVRSLPNSLSKKVRGLCFIFTLMLILANSAQNKANAQDTIAVVPAAAPADTAKIHSPRKALILAFVLPGSGQIYNRKYWKAPIVYVGFGTCVYFIVSNTKTYRELSAAYDWTIETSQTNYPPYPANIFRPLPSPPNIWATKGYTADQLKQGREVYRRYLEMSYIFTGVWYILTVVDAVVDAQFFDYNINDDLTLNIQPWIPTLGMSTNKSMAGGVSFSLRF